MTPIATLRQKAREWANDVQSLSRRALPIELEPERQRLMNWAKKIKVTVESVLGTVDEFAPLNLGFLPIVVGGVTVAGAMAAVAAWYKPYLTLVKNADIYDGLVKDGLSPSEAARIAYREKPTFLGNLKSLGVLALLGGGMFLLSKYI